MALAKWVLKLPWDVLSMAAEKHGLEPELVAAVAYQESGGHKYAMRYEPNWGYFYRAAQFATALSISTETENQLQKFSYGYMQVMGSVAREFGYKDSLVGLFEPFDNFEYGCAKLASCMQRYPDDVRSAVAAYNAGTARVLPATQKFRNESYVTAVMALYQNLTRSSGDSHNKL